MSRAIDITPNGFRAVMEICLHGTWFCSQEVAKHMVARGRGGVVLNIVAPSARLGMPGTAHTAAAKAGVLNMTRSLAVEWATYGIRVNALSPGFVETDNATKNVFGGGEFLDQMRRNIPLGRFGAPDDIAEAA